MLNNLLVFLTIFCSYFSYVIMYKIIIKDKEKLDFHNIMILLILSFLYFLINKLDLIFINIFFSILIVLLVLILFYDIPFKKAIYFSLVFSLISLFFDAFISIIINSNDLNYVLNSRIFRSLLTLPVIILDLIFITIPFVQRALNNFYEKVINKISITKSFALKIFIATGLTLLIFWFNGYNRLGKNYLISFIYLIVFIFLITIVLNLIYKEYQTKILNQRIVDENKYMKDIARQEKEFKHNLINNLLGIKTVASKKVNQLIDELISEYKTDYKNILNINDLPDGVLSIIYRKAYEENIDNLNLAVDNKIKKDLIDMLSPKNYNKFCTSIGILFDNALDAVKSCKEKIIEINFLEDEEYIYYIQKNSFTNVIDLEQTGTKEYTTKKNGHGIGLSYLNNLKNIETKNTVINNMFITKMKIKKIKM